MDAPADDPFGHLDNGLWQSSRSRHVTLVAVGLPLMALAALVFLGVTNVVDNGTLRYFRAIEWAALLSVLAGSGTGAIAWFGLCLLFFKRCDVRWQCVIWRLCLVHGGITLPCILGWIAYFVKDAGLGYGLRADVYFFTLAAIITWTASACLVWGRRYSRLARQLLCRS